MLGVRGKWVMGSKEDQGRLTSLPIPVSPFTCQGRGFGCSYTPRRGALQTPEDGALDYFSSLPWLLFLMCTAFGRKGAGGGNHCAFEMLFSEDSI